MITNRWTKSSRCETSACVEIAWRTAGRCELGGCVQAGTCECGEIHVRDSKLGETSPVLTFTPQEWSAFTAGIRNGEFDL